MTKSNVASAPEIAASAAENERAPSSRQRMEVSNVHRLNVLGQFDEIF